MIISSLNAYLYCYDHGLSFPKEWMITNNFSWREAFTNEILTDGVPILEVFQNIEAAAKVFQQARTKLGKPFIIHCWTRQIPHNKRAKSTAKRSPHINGRAIDFHVNGMSDKTVRDKLLSYKLPIRIEDGTNGWVHIDIGNSYTNDFRWRLFKP